MLRTARALVLGLLAATTVVLASPVAIEPAAAQAPASVTFNGHGYGHGRGLGQWGSLGYALAGFSYEQILGHYYGGTWTANIGLPNITVRLLAADGQETIVTSPRGGIEVGGVGAIGANAVRLARTGSGQFFLYTGPGCGGPWSAAGPIGGSQVVVRSQLDPADVGNLLQRCESGRTRSYRGDLVAVDAGSSQATINSLPLESYLRGVVPQESPPGWATQGGGLGMEALKAQSVAARSYALAENRWSFARTCDTTSCQVYGGAAVNPTGGARIPVEDSRTDAAIAGTAGFVRKFLDRDQVARTEFSSSTGGYTAGGTFPAVVDDGDAVASNPHHNWSQTFTLDELTNAFGVGSVTSVEVTARNGLGQDGGRVTQVLVRTTSGSTSMSGETVRGRLGLRSNWFTPSGVGVPTVGPPGGYRLGADGTLLPFGAAPASSVAVAAGTGRGVAVGGPARTAGYVLANGGALVPFGGAPAVNDGPTWGFDAARDLELRRDGRSGYVLDLFGGLWPFGGAPAAAATVYRTDGGGMARSLVLRPDGTSGWVVFRDGQIGSFGGAPAQPWVVLSPGRQAVGGFLGSDGHTVILIDDGGGLIRSDGAVLRNGGAVNAAVAGDARADGSAYVLAPNGPVQEVLGAPPVLAGATAAVVDVTLVPELAGYTVDFAGGLHPFGGAPRATATAYFGGWDIARGVAVGPAGTGYVLDGWGGLHPFGTTSTAAPPPVAGGPYWYGWDIARGVALLPGSTSSGYVLDGWGGLHAFGGAPAARGGPYWRSWDIARAVALLPDGSGGYVLDGFGGLHPFAVGQAAMPPPASGGPYFGRDFARGLAVLGPGHGAVVDAAGGVHGFGAPASSQSGPERAGVAMVGDPATGWMVWAANTGQVTGVNVTPTTPAPDTWGFSAVRGAAAAPAA